MTLKSLTTLAAIGLLAMACNDRTESPTSNSAQPKQQVPEQVPEQPAKEAVPSSAISAPLVAKIDGPSDVDHLTEVELQVSIERTLINEAPMKFMLEVPSGAKLVEGNPVETIVDAESATLVRHFRLSFGSVPADDVVATVSVKQPGWGVHATAKYRFGRPAPTLPKPERADFELGVGGRVLGSPIVVKP